MSRLGLEMNIREPAEPCVNLLLRSLAQKWKKRHLTLKVFLPSIYVSFLAHRLLSDLFLTNVQSVNNNDIYGLSLKKKRVTKSIQIAADLSIVKLGRSCLFLEFTHSNKFLTLFGCICMEGKISEK